MTTITQIEASQLLPNLFPFLDVSTAHACKLVNKDWNQQITKCYQTQELRLFSELYSLSEATNKDELTTHEISKINLILLETSKAMVFLQKSFLYDPKGKHHLRELMSYVHPPQPLYNLFYLFVALIDPPNVSWKKVEESDERSSFRQLHHFGVEQQLRDLQGKLTQPQFLLEINQNSIQKAEKFLKEKQFEPAKLRQISFPGVWVFLILKSVKLRLELSEKTRNIFDQIYLRTSFEKREELVKVNREKEVCNLWILRKKYDKKIADYEKRLEELAVRREKNNIELTVLKHAMQDLKIEMQEIQRRSKK